MTLELEGLEVDCVIGDLPSERAMTQRLVVGVRLEIPDAVSESDDIADTVDYAALASGIRDALVAARCRMIERAAAVALGVCMEFPSVAAARVRVVKSGAVPGLAAAAATVERRR